MSEEDFRQGDCRHYRFGLGEFAIHDLANVGDADLVFTTVEFLQSANEPLVTGEPVSLKAG